MTEQDMNPELFRWARETAGLEVDAAAKALGIKSDTLRAVEQGDAAASRAQLLNMTKVYHRPLVTFYLPKPPARGERGEDFRTLPPDRTVADDAVLDALLRDIRSRQALVRSLAEDEDEAAPLPFIGSATASDGVDAVLSSIKQSLQIDLQEYRNQKSADLAFNYLRNKAEDAGIFVLLMGNLGTHHSAIDVKTFRGFAISDRFAPFVVINDQDARTAWAFTLLHEVAHLWLGTSGVSGHSYEKAIERFCNEVASRFLVPTRELAELLIGEDTPLARAIELIGEFAAVRFVSRRMVAYGLLKANKISLATWQVFDSTLHALWLKDKASQKAKAKEKEGDGPSYYVVKQHRLGSALLGFVKRSIGSGTLTPVKAAKVLGVKPRSVYPLLMTARRGDHGTRG
jgi:Zn-dependent peptidase ImmA (M78 family)/DNA-binding XRE family transcriptional regulator